MGGASLTTCSGAMLLYYFVSMDLYDHDEITNEGGQQRPLSKFKSFLAFVNRRENRSLAIFGLWLTTIEVDVAIVHLHSDPQNNPSEGWFSLSAIFWFSPPLLYFGSKIRNILYQMSPSEISSYLSTNILAIGISSLTPMIYLSLDTIKCASNADHTQNVWNQCSEVYVSQQSICIFLLVMMVAKAFIAPLSTTTLTANDLIELNLPCGLIFQGALLGISFLLNF